MLREPNSPFNPLQKEKKLGQSREISTVEMQLLQPYGNQFYISFPICLVQGDILSLINTHMLCK